MACKHPHGDASKGPGVNVLYTNWEVEFIPFSDPRFAQLQKDLVDLPDPAALTESD